MTSTIRVSPRDVVMKNRNTETHNRCGLCICHFEQLTCLRFSDLNIANEPKAMNHRNLFEIVINFFFNYKKQQIQIGDLKVKKSLYVAYRRI